ncbi:MAG: peptidylprolyl isomerase [Oscillospiraceae bacterium]|jgi:cyclophilin family peptidyl-prolyl cis-trans isomerase|nr:peptidylprolyl isomerase [Oscillospiraceae bacterium]
MRRKKALRALLALIITGLLASAAAAAVLFLRGGGEDERREGDLPRVRVEMESGGVFVIELYPQYAPATAANFLALVGEGFYDGLTFHRIIDGYMAVGGAPDAAGAGGSGNLPGEFAANGYAGNTLSHTKGVVSMIRRADDPNSAGSQFFILLSNNYTRFDGEYAAFGKVVEGMDVVDAFQFVERALGPDGRVSSPVKPVVMKKLAVVSEG